MPASKCSYAGMWDRGGTDIINVEILSINGEDFKGSFKRSEALYIWTEVLGQEAELLHCVSFKMLPRKPLQIDMRLKNQINIDDAFNRDDFSYIRGVQKPDGSYDIVCGRILGLKKPKKTMDNTPRHPSSIRVNPYACDFDLTKEQIFDWISKFGQIMSGPQDIMDCKCPNLASGIMSVLILLERQIPSFFPVYGKRIQVGYRGMVPVCSNCFDENNMRVECGDNRANFFDYVNMLIKTQRFEPTMFG